VWRGLGLAVGSAGGLAALHGVQPLLFDLFLRSLRLLSFVRIPMSSPSSLLPSSPLALSPLLAGSGGAGGVVAWAWAVGGVAAVALGAKMWARRCYSDPAALEAYYRDFCREGFVRSVERHGFENLLRIATREGLAIRLAEEMQDVRGFDQLWRTYGGHHLSLFLTKRVLTRDYLRGKFSWEFDPDHQSDPSDPHQRYLLLHTRYTIY
jgi:hypothetical protein